MSSIKQEQSVLITAMLLSLFWIGKLIVLISLLVEHIFDMNFEEGFFKHFTTLGTCFEVHVSLNINQCLSSETSKVTISLFYDEKFSKSVNLRNAVGNSLVKSLLIYQTFTIVAYFSIENLHMLLLSNSTTIDWRDLYIVWFYC